ncbi:DUF5942 domain-containing protein [Leptolyngbya sp. FACHB-261]|uniref:DUF5942 domain-containing protein n=1 Tax=Leptolyngbya sp. FACHB-261 TaxID=2692806 RepID=UPI001688A52F|nr:DUF5942 domain-containing protein [Leptolyngbya sp. FACHB-261]MBD2105143.1 S8 family serine peptidase [Leptolyngbya sp. FACHB-261]
MRRFWVLLVLLASFIGIPAFLGSATSSTPTTYSTIAVNFRDDLGPTDLASQVVAISRQFGVSLRPNSAFSGREHLFTLSFDPTQVDARQLLQQLNRSKAFKASIEYAEPVYTYHIPDGESFERVAVPDVTAADFPNDPLYQQQWNFRSINQGDAWKSSSGEGVTVAVIDTGIALVPDLNKDQFAEGYDFVSDDSDATDDNGHGTHVAGTIAQSTNNAYGVAGIAYDAKLMPLKVLDESGAGTTTDIAEAIEFAADNGADIINLSLGGMGDSQVLREAIEYAYNKGVLIVAAAGNSNSSSVSYPARYEHVVGVAALGPEGGRAPYSNFGAGVDISAPGGSLPAGGVLQNTIDGEGGTVFAAYQGTSMASPHVAGVAALVKASGVKEPEAILDVLKRSSHRVENDPLNYYGAGRLDAAVAMQEALHGTVDWRDFLRWLSENGYINPRFWFDGGVTAILPKLVMILVSYLIARLLPRIIGVATAWSAPMAGGLLFGSTGLFLLRGLFVFDAPQWPFRLAGSSLPELGNAIQGSALLNPVFASVVLPFLLAVFLLGSQAGRNFVTGLSIGVGSFLLVTSLTTAPMLLWFPDHGLITRGFLLVNAALCVGLAVLTLKSQPGTATDG